MLQEFGDEPLEAELCLFRSEASDFFLLAGGGFGAGFFGDEDQFRFEPLRGFGNREGFRGLAAGAEVEEFLAVGFKDEDGGSWGASSHRLGLSLSKARLSGRNDGWRGLGNR